MTRTLLLALVVLLMLPTSLVAAESAEPGSDVPTTHTEDQTERVRSVRALNLVPILSVPELRLASRSMDEATMKTARVLNPFLKVAPLVIGIPLGVAGVSIAASVPIALSANDPFAASQMYSAGMGLMGGAFASVLTFNILARTLRFFLDAGPWQKNIELLAIGAPLSIGGYVLVAIAAQFALNGTWPDGAIAAGLAGGATMWGVGLALMMIDTLQTAWKDNDPKITARELRPGVKFAGVWAAPVTVDGATTPNGAAAGIALRW